MKRNVCVINREKNYDLQNLCFSNLIYLLPNVKESILFLCNSEKLYILIFYKNMEYCVNILLFTCYYKIK